MHDIVDSISLEIAKRVGERLRADPSLLGIAKTNLARWKADNADCAALIRNYAEWEAILQKPIEEVLRILCAVNDEGQRLRQNSPFVGILPQSEVRELKKKLRQGEATTA